MTNMVVFLRFFTKMLCCIIAINLELFWILWCYNLQLGAISTPICYENMRASRLSHPRSFLIIYGSIVRDAQNLSVYSCTYRYDNIQNFKFYSQSPNDNNVKKYVSCFTCWEKILVGMPTKNVVCSSVNFVLLRL